MSREADETTGPVGSIRRALDSFRVYSDRRVVIVLFLGFSSGLPLLLTLSTLSLWLATEGVSLTAIGLFSLVGLPYGFKFLWAPVIDRVPLPWATARLGRRRSWALLTQVLLTGAIAGMAFSSPSDSLLTTALWAFLVAFFSASQDIVIDAFRVECLERRQQGAGAGVIVLGYRIGVLAAGAGALAIAGLAGWTAAYLAMAALMSVGMATVLLAEEPSTEGTSEALAREARVRRFLEERPALQGRKAAVLAWLHGAVVGPFADFMTRRGWVPIILFVLLYKYGDVIAGVMAMPFYHDLGFTVGEIAAVSNIFGLAATMLGGLVGGAMVYRAGIMRSLWVCGILQALANLMFAAQAVIGRDIYFLILTIGVENVTSGMATAAFVAYLSSLCNVAYTATQYALLSSLMAQGRTLLSASGGWLADQMDWVAFFIATTFASIPGLLLLLWLAKLEPRNAGQGDARGEVRTPGPARNTGGA